MEDIQTKIDKLTKLSKTLNIDSNLYKGLQQKIEVLKGNKTVEK